MKKCYLLLFGFFLLLLGQATKVNAQAFEWTKGIGGAGADDVFDVTTDDQGNSYVAAYVSGAASFGNLSTTGGSDFAVAKFDASGICLWANRVPATVDAVVYGAKVATDASGSVYFGYSVPVSYTITNGNTFLIHHYRLEKYSPSGTLLWARQPIVSTSPNSSVGRYPLKDLLIDESGCPVLVCFTTIGTSIVRYSPSGSIRWTQNIQTYSGESHSTGLIRKLARGPSGQIWVAGAKGGSIIFPSGLNLSGGTSFLARFDTLGQFNYQTVVGSSLTYGSHLEITSLAGLGNGNVAFSGRFVGTVGIGSTSYTSTNNGGPNGSNPEDQFVLELNPSGNAVWFHQFASPIHYSFSSQDLVADPIGNITLATNFATSASVYGTPITSAGQNDILIVRIAPETGTILHSGTIGGAGNDNPTALVAEGGGTVKMAGRFTNQVQFGNELLVAQGASDGFISEFTLPHLIPGTGTNTISGIVFSDLNNNGIRDAGEPLFTQPTVIQISPGPMFAVTNATGQFSINVDTGTFALSVYNLPAYHTVLPASDTVTFSGIHQTDSTIAFGLHTHTISGSVFNDLNNNGIREIMEPPFTQPLILEILPGPRYATTNASGEFAINAHAGTYTISIPNLPLYHSVLPASHTVTLSAQNQYDSTATFGVYDFGSTIVDLRALITAVGAFRPGFTGTYHLSVKNLGGMAAQNANLVLRPDPGLVYSGSTVTPTLVSADSIVWDFATVAPSQQINILVQFLVPAATPLGTVLSATCDLYPLINDFAPSNNHAGSTVTVTGSFDPNDKQVSDSVLTPAQVASQEWLDYTIRFQNTGTDTAFTVIITDSLSAMLNPATVEVLAASHSYAFEVSGPGIAQWQFSNILLPDSGTNEATSHGFVRFRVRPRNTLQLGDVIQNAANIYFDFNSPVITNTATTEIVLPVFNIQAVALSSPKLCAGDTFTQDFTATGPYDLGNEFVLQLSDTTGSFANPVTLGSLASTVSGSIQAAVPVSIPPGTGYRLRVVATTPATLGPDNGVDITVWPLPQVSVLLPDSFETATAPTLLSGGLPAGGIYSGPGVTNGTFDPAAAGPGSHLLSYSFTNAGGCSATATQTVIVYQLNAAPGQTAIPGFAVYPNPASETVKVAWFSAVAQPVQVQLRNMLGQVVARQKSQSVAGRQTLTLQVAQLPAGIYLLQLTEGQKTVQAKLVLRK